MIENSQRMNVCQYEKVCIKTVKKDDTHWANDRCVTEMDGSKSLYSPPSSMPLRN